MDSKDIEQLLEKYWNCETTLEEETQLREFFRQDDVEARWKEAAELFRYFEQQRNHPLVDLGFDAGILKKIQPKGKTIILPMNLMRIAAGLIVVVAATYFVRQEIRKSHPQEDTFSDPKIAFEETKRALMMISKGFGKGQKEASKINLFNDAEQKIQGKGAVGDEEKKNDSTSI